MKRPIRFAALVVVLILTTSRSARAGMPMVSLSDIAALRLEAISFFLVCFLASSGLVRIIWNSARKDFPRLPHLSYRVATGLVGLWGLLFLLVLTMISGARELMTPGAWHKEGLTYKLAHDEASAQASADQRLLERKRALDRLRMALWTYARQHAGKLPSTGSPPEIPDEAWIVPDPSGMRYLYTAGLVADQGKTPLAYEPGIFGTDRFVLLSSGAIVRMNADDLATALAERRPG
jgi:hypothetical protein